MCLSSLTVNKFILHLVLYFEVEKYLIYLETTGYEMKKKTR